MKKPTDKQRIDWQKVFKAHNEACDRHWGVCYNGAQAIRKEVERQLREHKKGNRLKRIGWVPWCEGPIVNRMVETKKEAMTYFSGYKIIPVYVREEDLG